MPRVFRMNISPKLCTMYSILVIRNLLSFQEGYFICMLCFRPPPPSCSQLLWKECKSVFQWAPLKPSPLWDADRQAGGLSPHWGVLRGARLGLVCCCLAGSLVKPPLCPFTGRSRWSMGGQACRHQRSSERQVWRCSYGLQRDLLWWHLATSAWLQIVQFCFQLNKLEPIFKVPLCAII